MKSIKYENILDHITKKNRINRFIFLIIGSFIVALIYNSFIVPNSLVYGGLGGLAIIVNKITGLDIQLFIDIITVFLVILSLILIGFKKTSYTIIGFLSYILMVNLTMPLAKYVTSNFDSFLFSVLIFSITAGFGFGLIYRAGFNTGGMDSVVIIAQKYFPFPTAYISNIINGILIIVGAFIFGPVKSIYAIIYLIVNNYVSNAIILGTSNSKICFIKTKHIHNVESYLSNDANLGYTLIESTNGIGIFKRHIIMCVVPSEKFLNIKKSIYNIDNKANIISNDCYSVIGGKINRFINF